EVTQHGNYLVTRTIGQHSPGTARLYFQPLEALDANAAFAAGTPEIRLGQLFDDAGRQLLDHSEVAIFRGHGFAPTASGFGGFGGLPNREAASFAADQIVHARAAGQRLNYVALESCFQGDYGYVAFGRTNAQAFQAELNRELQRRGVNTLMDGVQVLASDRPG